MYYTLADTGRGFLEQVWEHFQPSLAKDATLKADTLRLKKRLADRRDGICCRGFGGKCNE
jgi:hypothetical protein